MADEFNITADKGFFLGEDKIIDFVITGQDKVTPLNILGMALDWALRKTDKAADPAIIHKAITSGGVSTTGMTIVGTYNAIPASNTQKVRLTFASAETDPVVTSGLGTPYTLKPNVEYRHSLKRMDSGNEGILSYGSLTFVQATER